MLLLLAELMLRTLGVRCAATRLARHQGNCVQLAAHFPIILLSEVFTLLRITVFQWCGVEVYATDKMYRRLWEDELCICQAEGTIADFTIEEID